MLPGQLNFDMLILGKILCQVLASDQVAEPRFGFLRLLGAIALTLDGVGVIDDASSLLEELGIVPPFLLRLLAEVDCILARLLHIGGHFLVAVTVL